MVFLCYKVRSSFNSIDMNKNLMFTETLFCDILASVQVKESHF